MSKSGSAYGRREFVKSSVAATGSLLFVKPETAFGTQANSRLNMGLLGCGGRGNSVAEDFVNNTDVQVTVLADMFQDRLDETKKHFDDLQAGKGRSQVLKTFQGPNAYQEIVQSDVDIVYIATPPYFHPLHAKTSIEAGKHTYLEKPVSTDVKGCMDVAALADKAEGKISVDVGFQIRYGKQFVTETEKLHNGAIGDIVFVDGYYLAGDLPRKGTEGMSAAERKLRDWVFWRVLGGDIIVEQNIHIIDVFNWTLQAHPLRAQATAGRKVRTDVGDVMDHYVVTYFYPNDVRASFQSTQFLPVWAGVEWRFFGPKGFAKGSYSSGLSIEGANPWVAGADQAVGGKAPEIDPLGDATPNKAKAFVESITSGNFHNQLKQGAESTLSAILGRQAAYEGREMTWGELLASNQDWETDIDVSKLG